jgi:hypothetical protein
MLIHSFVFKFKKCCFTGFKFNKNKSGMQSDIEYGRFCVEFGTKPIEFGKIK